MLSFIETYAEPIAVGPETVTRWFVTKNLPEKPVAVPLKVTRVFSAAVALAGAVAETTTKLPPPVSEPVKVGAVVKF